MKSSFISKKPIPKGESIQGSEIRAGIFELIHTDHPGFSVDSYISLDELNLYRRLYLSHLMELERGELALLDREVMKAIRENSVLSEKIEESTETELTLGERMADRIASFGGSWTFIIAFFSFLLGWIFINGFLLVTKPFDPFPFILLNLMLSCLAAIQAPIIMMSQNRQEAKDRQRAEHDYKINLKAELEIKLLGEKIDHLLVHQNKKLLEIQEVQVDYLEDLLKKIKEKRE
ncbi:DUF1003 domain-containing protein [Algoriphagus lacus]|uniref:DUF1003 domain-containing protein n=1 Tax=Algoriphagus lacus TaxID=2056311 RepID=A0A418PQF3_9BACT|nr:DUF1003 domain-containing protein [Algoriphagus lacus]RIW14547.1 DUF1003 domain-containing protein [Algoriphagus lacus]